MTTRLAKQAALLALIVLVLAACGQTQTPSPDNTPVSTSQTTPQETQVTGPATTEMETPTPTTAAEETLEALPDEANSVDGHALITETLPFSQELMDQLTLPEGFGINVFARDLNNVRMIAVAEDGTVYVTRRDQGDVIALVDLDGDGEADGGAVTVAANMPLMHGITIHENRMYLATDTHIYVADITGPGTIGELKAIVTDLPTGGQHPNRTLAVGPDRMLYVTVGSLCNACDPDKETAAILRMGLDGNNRETFAQGLRNTIGFGWHPVTEQLWGMDHGSDWRGDDQPPEELNNIQQGANYGWPYCWGDQEVDVFIPSEPKGSTKEAFCPTTTSPVLTYQAHSAPIGMVFYTADQFPGEYLNSTFIVMRGSWNRVPATGYKVVLLRFDENGRPTGFEDFVSSWLVQGGVAHFARPAGIAIASDGSLLITDDKNGVIYRVAYTASQVN